MKLTMSKPTYYWSYISVSLTIGLLFGICVTYTLLKVTFIEHVANIGPIPGDDIRDTLMKNIDTKRIEYLLKILSQNDISNDMDYNPNTVFVYKLWSELGLNTSFANYSVLTSHQNKEMTNAVTKYDKNGQILYTASSKGTQFNLAYSQSTDSSLNGTPIYVNFGRHIDFYELSRLNVSVRQHFVISRYSDIPPGYILKLAQEKGAIGLIMFSDSLSGNQHGLNDTLDHFQYDHVLLEDGDPQTPFYPSIDSSYRTPISESLPEIPALFVNYADAINILKGLKGGLTPPKWKINPHNSNIGPDYEDGSYLTLEVNTYLKRLQINNVIGVIEGCIEPDRYVIVGSGGTTIRGTAALILLSESFAKTMKSMNWCPQRSIIFCSWAPQQYRSIGSTEWIEENQVLLSNGAIAYISVDLKINGNFTFMANSVPILYKTIYTVTESVKNPNQDEIYKDNLKTVYDSYYNHGESQLYLEPDIGLDYVNSLFLQGTGIPVVEYYYNCDKSSQNHCQTLPELIFNPMDTDFNFSKALIEVSAETLRLLCDRPLLPFSESLNHFYSVLDKNSDLLKDLSVYKSVDINLDDFGMVLFEFESAIDYFKNMIERTNEQDDLLLRKLNDILMRFEQTFIDREGLPYATHQRHVLYASSLDNPNRGQIFPGLYFLLRTYIQETDEVMKMKVIEQLKKHISVIIFHLNSAIHLLRQTFNQ